MRIIPLAEIKPILADTPAILEVIRQSFIDHSGGKITMPDPVQLLFRSAEEGFEAGFEAGEDINSPLIGDCHIKTASSKALPYFCIKVATGFYKNPSRGLAVNNGLVMLMCAQTGAPLALFQDEGHLTSTRTAAAGALAASLRPYTRAVSLGVIGTGHQAELQARWISTVCSVSEILIWGRTAERVARLTSRLKDLNIKAVMCRDIEALCGSSKIIVATTPSQSPLVLGKHVQAGHHIIAVGADSPGKTEIAPEVMARADLIITDDRAQCLHHGEFGHAVRAGLIDAQSAAVLGQVLSAPKGLVFEPSSISVVDLTGLGAQDLAIAAHVYRKLGGEILRA